MKHILRPAQPRQTEEADILLDQVAISHGLGADLDREIRTLSHGNKQKLGIIQACQLRAPLLILDEPTKGLDPLVQHEFYRILEEARAEGRTVFLSSHNLTEIERICDRVASIRQGALVAVDDVAALRAEAVRMVEFTCEREPEAAAFHSLVGVADLEVQDRTVRCTVRGPLGALIHRVEPYGIVDMLSRVPSLEEFFLARYGVTEDRDAPEGEGHAG